MLKTSSRHVLRTPSTRFQRTNFWSSKTTWRCLEDVLEDEKLLCWRRIEEVLKTCLEDVFKTCTEDVLKTCLQDILETKKWVYLCLTNLNGYVSNKEIFHKSISDESKAHPKSLIRTQWFQYYRLTLKFKQHFYFEY